jgi:hypothetical protein
VSEREKSDAHTLFPPFTKKEEENKEVHLQKQGKYLVLMFVNISLTANMETSSDLISLLFFLSFLSPFLFQP